MGFIFIFPLSLRKITHVVAPPQKLVMSLWNKEIFRPEAVTSGAGEGEDVVTGSVPAPGSRPREAGQARAAAAAGPRGPATPQGCHPDLPPGPAPPDPGHSHESPVPGFSVKNFRFL